MAGGNVRYGYLSDINKKWENFEFADLDKVTGHEAEMNILLQNLLTILNWERDLRNSIRMENVRDCAHILDCIVIMAAPLVGYASSVRLNEKMAEVNRLAFPIIKQNPNTSVANKRLAASQNQALIAIKDCWMAVRLALQSKGLLLRKQTNPREAVKG